MRPTPELISAWKSGFWSGAAQGALWGFVIAILIANWKGWCFK